MSRLDSFIRRLTAQRACLAKAFDLIRDLPGPVIELGLGNGRTYDHLRQNLPDRRIIVFERSPSAHPDCMPSADDLVVGPLQETLPNAAEFIGEPVALLHSDIGCGIAEVDRQTAALISRQLPSIMAPGGVVLSDQPLSCQGFRALSLPGDIKPGRYTILERIDDQRGTSHEALAADMDLP